jgi:calcineurin-like phosphoesterase family protein
MKNDEIDLDAMHEAIIQRHNAIVGEDDLTYLLGDFAFCKPDQAMKFMMRMNGKKILVHGNHDRKLVGSNEFKDSSMRRMAGLIEDTPYKMISHKHPNNGASYGVALFHFRIAEWDGAHRGSLHCYGHSHGSGPISEFRCMDIGLDTNDLRPYRMDDVVRVLSAKKVYESGHHTTGKME